MKRKIDLIVRSLGFAVKLPLAMTLSKPHEYIISFPL